ncbi:YbdD/YjiX family protein [Microvirga sp. Mcv34]|uniref:YbdD/YjiX family protein n=1 Tax=Microvirga sp. Mcv34 TaxID=2926016 RepID=UPI0021CA628E|nr:YbdD/YjiX family protein [Microvirga sp. Mcv34]
MLKPDLRKRWSDFTKCVCQGARLMVGVPDYETYVEHMRRNHPDRSVMAYPDFFRERQAARYGGEGRSGFRCC